METFPSTTLKDPLPDTEEASSVVKPRRSLLNTRRHPPTKKKRVRGLQYKECLDDIPKGGNDKRRKQLERNRKSARESRRRKKLYIQQLEIKVRRFIIAQNQELLNEVNYYKAELAKVTASAVEGHEEYKESTEGIKEFLSPVCKYLIWAAIHNEGPYKSEEQKIDLILDEDYLLFPKGSGELDFLDVEDKRAFFECQASINNKGITISEHIKEMEAHKRDFLKELRSLEKLLQKEVFSRMDDERIKTFTQWIESVSRNIT